MKVAYPPSMNPTDPPASASHRSAGDPASNRAGDPVPAGDRGQIGDSDRPAEPALPSLSPSGLYNLMRPSRCDLREWLRSHDYAEEPHGAFTEILFGMGIDHERRHLQRFPGAIDIAELPASGRREATREQLDRGERVIYQGVLRAVTTLAGREVEIIGHPDFMLPARRGWAIRDSKLARSLSDYIRLQLLTYGWLYEQTTGKPPVALHMHAGSGEIHDVPYEDPDEALAMLERMLELRGADERPLERVGTSKCSGCGFRDHCWPQALARKELGTLPRVDRGLVDELAGRGIETAPELLERFDVDSLAKLERPWRGRRKPVGERAEWVITSARAHVTEQPVLRAEPELPEAATWVMFDLEGMPPRYDTVERIYLWGLQCFGAEPGPFEPALADFEPGGDGRGWRRFLAAAEAIFDRHGDIPFVHWATYERVKIDLYITRHGDPDGIAARVKANLLDLLPITVDSVAVPRSTYSLKDIETVAGYERQLEEFGGDWSIAKYVEAADATDPARREAIMAEICDYNREDLEATWAVLEWLRGLGG